MKIHYSKMEFVWVCSHWDMHLAGLCRIGGKLHRFETDIDTEVCTVYPLTWLEKINWIRRKKLFEWMVGYHWTYPYCRNRQLRPHSATKKPKWFWRFLFTLYYFRKFYFPGRG